MLLLKMQAKNFYIFHSMYLFLKIVFYVGIAIDVDSSCIYCKNSIRYITFGLNFIFYFCTMSKAKPMKFQSTTLECKIFQLIENIEIFHAIILLKKKKKKDLISGCFVRLAIFHWILISAFLLLMLGNDITLLLS